MKKIVIFDTTLRDGEQSPGASMNPEGKIRIAKQLVRLNVGVIEAGYPFASKGDFECVKAISEKVKGVQIAALARCVQSDIDTAWEAILHADNPRLHLFLATSDIHLKHKLKISRSQMLERAIKWVGYASSLIENVQFSAEDATRSDMDFVCKVFKAVIDNGATTVNFPDTTGYTWPDEFGRKIKYLIENVPNIHKAVLSVHCHNDLGLAVANSLAAINNGAGQVECTINGLGERAGNASLEEIVMAIRTRPDQANVDTGIVTQHIYPTSRMVSSITGLQVQSNKAIVGANAFAHESGIHQDGVLKERTTYEIMDPADIGLTSNNIVLGKHSGRHAISDRAKSMGYTLSDDELNRVFARFKEIADLKRDMFDEDLEAIIMDEVLRIPEFYKLESLGVMGGNKTIPTTGIRLIIDGAGKETSSTGIGSVDSIFSAINKATGRNPELVYFGINSITGGTDAQAEVSTRLREDNKTVVGTGVDPDIITAAAKAYLNALNRLVYTNGAANK